MSDFKVGDRVAIYFTFNSCCGSLPDRKTGKITIIYPDGLAEVNCDDTLSFVHIKQCRKLIKKKNEKAMSSNPKIITIEILKSLDPCTNGFEKFCKLLPNGGTLKECINALVNDGHDSWGKWLFDKCRNLEDFKEQTLNGYWNSGDWNSGDWNSGDRNSGDWNSGDWNSGYRNSGDWNSGNRNSGDWNSGDWNSGDRNSGNRNSGDWNSGYWNSGDWNSGFFNTETPDEILVFNKICKRMIWENSEKPQFIFFDLCVWISENKMSDQEKINNPHFYITGGYLKELDYKEAWRKAWDSATEEDKKLLFKLPNFDKEVFKKISGIDVEKGEANDI